MHNQEGFDPNIDLNEFYLKQIEVLLATLSRGANPADLASSLAKLMAFSERGRFDALRQYEAKKIEFDKLVASLVVSRDEMAILKADNKALTAKVDKLVAENHALAAKVDKLATENQALSAEVKSSHKKLDTLQGEVDELKRLFREMKPHTDRALLDAAQIQRITSSGATPSK